MALTKEERAELVACAQAALVKLADSFDTETTKCESCGIHKHNNRQERHTANDVHTIIRKLGRLPL